MDNYVYFDRISARVRALYFAKGAAAVCEWVKNHGSHYVLNGLRQVLQEYEDEGFSEPYLCINIIGNKEMIILVAYDSHLLVWRVKECN